LSLIEALPIALLGALLGLDVVSFPQAMISRPIVAATLAGGLIGHPSAGLLIGVFLELIALDTLPFGASRYPEWGSAGVVGGALYSAQAPGMPGALPASMLAALLTASIRLGAMSANATPARLKNLTVFGQSLGLAFQVIDDILDVTQTTEKLGKTAGKDVAATKATYPAIFGLERSREEAHRLTLAAHAALKPFGKQGATLRAFADYLLVRDY